MDEVWIVLLSIGAGGAGYLFITFGMRPTLRYIDLKHQLLSDLIFYANSINADGMDKSIKERMLRRIEANRRHSAELTACYMDLPFWYKWWIKWRKQSPERASNLLMGLSNTYDEMKAADRIDAINEVSGI